MSTLQVAAAQAGDERAFRALVEPYRRALEVHCYRMLGSVHDAEDVIQDTLLRAWRSFERFERPLVGRDLAVPDRHQRLPGRAREAPAPRPSSPTPTRGSEDADTSIADPAARYALREGMELAFLTAIQRLPGRQRAVLILRDVLGWTGAEAAELLDTTVTAVNSALQRARATIEAEAPARAVAPGRRTQRELLRALRRRLGAGGHRPRCVALLREDAVLTMPPEGAICRRARRSRRSSAGALRRRRRRDADLGQPHARRGAARRRRRAAPAARAHDRRRADRAAVRVRAVQERGVTGAVDHLHGGVGHERGGAFGERGWAIDVLAAHARTARACRARAARRLRAGSRGGAAGGEGEIEVRPHRQPPGGHPHGRPDDGEVLVGQLAGADHVRRRLAGVLGRGTRRISRPRTGVLASLKNAFAFTPGSETAGTP